MRQPIKINKTNPNKGVLDYSYLLDAPDDKTAASDQLADAPDNETLSARLSASAGNASCFSEKGRKKGRRERREKIKDCLERTVPEKRPCMQKRVRLFYFLVLLSSLKKS